MVKRQTSARIPAHTSARARATCPQMNIADSERMAGALEAAGYVCSPNPGQADVLVYNTCSIREKAETKVYSALGKQAKRKRARVGSVKVVVAGCVAQQEGQALLRRVPEVDVVMGPQYANRIVDLLERAEAGQVGMDGMGCGVRGVECGVRGGGRRRSRRGSWR